MAESSGELAPPRLEWTGSGVFLILLHAAVLIGVPLYVAHTPLSWPLIGTTLVVMYASLIGITAGYHRLYAHQAYAAARPVEAVFLFLGTLAFQGPAIRWSFDHRAHHRHVDREGDPYNVRHGFWHAHVLWIFSRPRPIDGTVKDLWANPLAKFQYRYYVPLALASNALVALAAGWLLHDTVGAFVVLVGVRLVLSYHITWCINSLAHYWGSRSYSKELTARDNYIVAMITVGEGYHNYHHVFASDYRNGIHWYHVDPGKWVIWLLSRFRLAWNLQRQPEEKVRRIQVRLDTELLLQRLRHAASAGAAEFRTRLETRFGPLAHLEANVIARSESLKAKIEELAHWREAKRTARAGHPIPVEHHGIHERVRELQRSFRTEWTEWCQLCGVILQS
ncbi:MAG: acyl-CoA desaturase [Hyphomicrobiales bacterium]